MDYFGDLLLLALDSMVFAGAVKFYINKSNALNAVKDLEVHDVDEVKELLKANNGRIPYAAVQGTVKAVGNPIHSINQHDITGVVQRVQVREHTMKRGSGGFWTSHNRTLQDTFSYVPFVLCSENESAEVLEPLKATIDLYTVADKFDPANPTIGDHMWGILAGIRPRGIQCTEQILKEETRLTAIGEVSLAKDGTRIIIEHPDKNLPYLLTTNSLRTIVSNLKSDVTLFKFIIAASAICGGVLISVIAYRWWQKRTKRIRAEQRRQRRETARNSQPANEEVPDCQLCVICWDNRREIIILPCGHFCMCEDCSDKVTTFCPMCRTSISSKSQAYF